MSPSPPEQQSQNQPQPQGDQGAANPARPPNSNQQANEWTNVKEQIKQGWYNFTDSIKRNDNDKLVVALSTIVIAAFTGLLFVATFLLWSGGERHAERQLRAYVTILNASVQLVNLIEGGRGFRILLELKNTGQTPGYDFTTWFPTPVILNDSANPFGPRLPIGERSGRSIIGAGTSVWMERTIKIDDAEFATIKAGTKKIFVWGGADYADAFGKPRYFIFRATNANAALINEPGNTVALAPHKAGYEGD